MNKEKMLGDSIHGEKPRGEWGKPIRKPDDIEESRSECVGGPEDVTIHPGESQEG